GGNHLAAGAAAPIQILLDRWPEACRPIELGEAMPRLAARVRRRLPADLLLIRRVDASTETVDTVAASASERLPLPRQARSQFDAHDAERLLHWAQTGKPARLKATERGHPLAALVPESIRGSVAAGPLRPADGAAGVLLLVRRAPASFSADELETL